MPKIENNKEANSDGTKGKNKKNNNIANQNQGQKTVKSNTSVPKKNNGANNRQQNTPADVGAVKFQLDVLFEKFDSYKNDLNSKNIFQAFISIFANWFDSKETDDKKLFIDKLNCLKKFYLKNKEQQVQNNIREKFDSFCCELEMFLSNLTGTSSKEGETLEPENNSKDKAKDKTKNPQSGKNQEWIDGVVKNKDYQNRLDMLVLKAVYIKNMQKIQEVRENICPLKYGDKEYKYAEFETLKKEIRDEMNEVGKKHGANDRYNKLFQNIKIYKASKMNSILVLLYVDFLWICNQIRKKRSGCGCKMTL